MKFIIIRFINNKIIFENELGESSKEWGPRMHHKGTNIYLLAKKLLSGKIEIKIPYNGDTFYVLMQPDLFLLSELRKVGGI